MDQGVVSRAGSRLGSLRVSAEPVYGDTNRNDTERPPVLLWQLVNAQAAEWRMARVPITDAAGVRVGDRTATRIAASLRTMSTLEDLSFFLGLLNSSKIMLSSCSAQTL